MVRTAPAVGSWLVQLQNMGVYLMYLGLYLQYKARLYCTTLVSCRSQWFGDITRDHGAPSAVP